MAHRNINKMSRSELEACGCEDCQSALRLHDRLDRLIVRADRMHEDLDHLARMTGSPDAYFRWRGADLPESLKELKPLYWRADGFTLQARHTTKYRVVLTDSERARGRWGRRQKWTLTDGEIIDPQTGNTWACLGNSYTVYEGDTLDVEGIGISLEKPS